MNAQFEVFLVKIDPKSIALFREIDALIHESVRGQVNEKIWQNHALYFAGDKEEFKPFSGHEHNHCLHIAPFKGHVNIYAPEVLTKYYGELQGYKITPKAEMLQIFCGQKIPREILRAIFKEALI